MSRRAEQLLSTRLSIVNVKANLRYNEADIKNKQRRN